MPTIELRRILDGVDFSAPSDALDIKVRRITADSKSVERGDLFVAIRGHRFDGHDFLDEVIEKGAAAVVTEKKASACKNCPAHILVNNTKKTLPLLAANFYGDPSKSIKIIGVTGTNGKTTVTHLVESILKASGFGVGVIGTIEYRIGEKRIESENTTPGALELQAIFKDIADAGLDYAAMEVSSHGLAQDRISGIEFDAACFTNITKEHLDYHKTMGSYLKAKSRIFKYLKKDGVALLNSDDKNVIGLQGSIKNSVVTYGLKGRPDITAKDISISLDGSSFTIETKNREEKIRTTLLGIHNISNILAASSIALAEGVDFRYIKEGIEGLKVVPGRLEYIGAKAAFRTFVDYAHTDDALQNVLGFLRSIAKRNIITVFGCGGDRDTLKRPRMGRVACELSDKVVITSDNPRTEKPLDIIEDILKGVRGRFANFLVEEDRKKAIEKAMGMAKSGDIVLIAGKGHERYQIIGDRIIPFDDREAAKNYLK